MELRYLTYFVAIADTLNFTKAAETLYISQSALSKQISMLEEELGVQLFERDKRHVQLTNAGRLLLPEAKNILMSTEKLIPMLRYSDHSAGNQIFIIALDSVLESYQNIQRLLTDSAYRIRCENPGLKMLFKRREYADIYHDLLDNQIDFAICTRPEPIENEEITSKLVYQEPHVLVLRTRTSIPDTPENVINVLNKRGIIVPEKDVTALELTLDILQKLKCVARIRFSEDRTSMVLNACIGDAAIFLPETVALQIANPELTILHLPDNIGQMYCYALWRKENKDPIIDKLTDRIISASQ